MPERYTRLAQRVNTWLTSTTGAGRLYDTDLRLRPDGAKGLIVSSLARFRRYQREKAWTWEHQALTRARFVAGDAAIGAAFEAEREAILRLPRDRCRRSRSDVVEMRTAHACRPSEPDARCSTSSTTRAAWSTSSSPCSPSCSRTRTRTPRSRATPATSRCSAWPASSGSCRVARAEVADAYRDYRRQQHAVRLTGAPHARVDPAPHDARVARAVNALWQAAVRQRHGDRRRRTTP